MKVVVVSSVKGGTGRTTVAAHLGIALANADRTCLVVDADPQNALGHWFKMDLSEHFGVARKGLVSEDLLKFVRRARTEVAYMPFGATGLPELAALHDEVEDDPEWLRRKLRTLAHGQFDVVIVDAPSGAGPLARACYHAADLVLSVIHADGATYATLPMLQELVVDLCETRGGFLGTWHLLNHYDARRPLQRDVRAAFGHLLQDNLLPVSLPVDESVREAFARRQSLIYQNADSPVLAGLRQVAAWLSGTLHDPGGERAVHVR